MYVRLQLFVTQMDTVFDELVSEALDGLPERFARLLDNVEIITSEWPTREELIAGRVPPGGTLFGLYRGIPRTKRGTYNAALPDRIIIFSGPLRQFYGNNPEALREQVRQTVLHELGHYFGLSETEIRNAVGNKR